MLRELGFIAGIVVTASPNPSEYNGYKVYWEDVAQVTAPKDKEITYILHSNNYFLHHAFDVFTSANRIYGTSLLCAKRDSSDGCMYDGI